jgi:hypothetical protein
MTRGSTSEHARTSGVTFWHLSIMPPAQGRGQVTAFVQKFKFVWQLRYGFNFPYEQCSISYASFIEIRYKDSLFGNGSRNTLLFIPRNLLPSFRYFFAPSLLEAKAGQIPMPIVPNRRSSFGMSCAHCDNELIAPEWSEFRNERQVHHVWRCWNCDCCFETIVDTKSIEDIMTRDDIFPALLVV